VNISTLMSLCIYIGRCSKLEMRQTSSQAGCSGIQTTWPEFMWTVANNSSGAEGWFGFRGCRGMGRSWKHQPCATTIIQGEEEGVATNIW